MSGDHKRGVGLLGRAGTGKSTIAAALVKAGVCDTVAGFADEMKNDLATLGCKKGDPGFRELAIAYGTTHKRAGSPDYWVERLRFKMHDDFDGVVVDDVRFPNEAAFLAERGFLLVRLEASIEARVQRGIKAEFAASTDATETGCANVGVDITFHTDKRLVGAIVADIAAAMQPVAA